MTTRQRLVRLARAFRSWVGAHRRGAAVVVALTGVALALWTLIGERSPALLAVLTLQCVVLVGLAVVAARTLAVLRRVRAQDKVLARVAVKVNGLARTRRPVLQAPPPPVDLTPVVHGLGSMRLDAALQHEELLDRLSLRDAAVEKAASERLQAHLTAEVQAVEKRLTTLLTTKFDDAIAENDALLSLHRLVTVDPGKPTSGGFAASPQTLLHLYTRALELPAETIVVECGSGASTVWLADACRRRGLGRVVALEHDETYAGLTRDALARQGLSDWAEVRCAPLEPVEIDHVSYPWYAPSTWDDLHDIGMLFVDGPPGSVGRRSRFPAYPLLAPALADGAAVALDDVQRAAEQEISRLWLDRTGSSDVTLTNGQRTGRTWFLQAWRTVS